MIVVRRLGLLLAAVLLLVGTVPALDIEPSADGDLSLAIGVAVLAVGVTIATLALIVPAWRGGRRSAVTIAVLQLVAILPALPAFFLPADVVPAGGVVVAAVGTLLNVAAFTMILLLYSNALLRTAAVVVVVAIYAGVVAVSSSLAPESAARTVQTLAAIAVALLFQPILVLLRRTVGRSLYGGRADPTGTALAIGRQLRSSEGPDAALEDVRAALRLPRLELLDAGEVRASSAAVGAAGRTVELPIDDQARLALRATLRPGEPRLGSSDRAALGLVAPPLGLLLRSAELAEAVRVARATTVQARERERSALHRELHDGLGPLLTGAVFRADAAHNLLPDRPEQADAALDGARSEIRMALAEVRRVVYGLRPLELEEHGLWDALRRRARHAGRVPISMSLPVPEPEVSPAVEVAAYRIVTEALANVERHSTGRGATVILSAGESLAIVVADDGRPAADWSPGVGVSSIRERAEELHGTAEIGPSEPGWRVTVTLPLG